MIIEVSGVKMKKMFNQASLLYLLCGLYLITTQEIDNFKEDFSIDFEKENVLAELPIPTKRQHTYFEFVENKSLEERDGESEKLKSGGEESENGGEKSEAKQEAMINTSSVTEEVFDNTTFVTSKYEDEETGGGRDLGEEPPNIRSPVSRDMKIVTDKNKLGYSVPCTASGNPKPSYSWYRNGFLVDDSSEYIKISSNGTLFFPEFTARENGVYQCKARNNHGVSLSEKVTILAEIKPGNPINESSNPQEYTGTEGQPLNVPCVLTPPTLPDYIKRWYTHMESNAVELNARVSTDLDGTLRFSYLLKEDAKKYVYALAPTDAEANSLIRKYSPVTVKVEPGTLDPTPPQLEYSSSNLKAILGKKVTLECFFSGYPVSNITWQDGNNHEIVANNGRFTIDRAYFGRRLIINKIEEMDAGGFTCTANNGHGTKSSNIHINVTAPPMKVPHNGIDRHTVPDSTNITLTCKGSVLPGQHMEAPVWFRNGQLFDENSLPDPARYRFSQDRTLLHIRNLKRDEDTACFQCNVSNSEGYLFYDGYLRVIESVEIMKRPDKIIHIRDRNASIDISVIARGDSCCTINKQWLLNGKVLTFKELNAEPFVWADNDQTLWFDVSKLDNGGLASRLGNYTCRVSNAYQVELVHFVITVNATKTPEPLESRVAETSIWWVFIVAGIILILVGVLVVVFVIKRNYPRNTYPLEKTELKHHLNPEEDLLNQSFQEI